MKTITKTDKYLLLLVLIIMGTTVACDKSENELKDPASFTIENAQYTLYKNSTLSHEADEKRSESYSAPFEIESVERVGGNLNINVAFQAGCEVNKFEILWDGLIMESYPIQTRLYIKRTISDCIYIDAIERATLTIDLNELAEKIGNDQILEAIITVSNTSKKVNMEDADVPVSSN